MKTLPGFLYKLNTVDYFAAVLKQYTLKTDAAFKIRPDCIVVTDFNLLVTV